MRKASFVLFALLLLCTSVIVYAVSVTFTFRSTLTVPPHISFTVYQSDGTTPVTSMQDLSSQWQWTGTQFILYVWIKNTGTAPVTPQFSFSNGTLSGWSFIVGGNATLTASLGENCSLTAYPPAPLTAGNSTGDFDIIVSAG